ncbi:hypothetical protein CEP52_014768 [Fusarium oligoseptatum]|uniref:MADS-box domain-containing protein n=1 Tax=Fusarium oligoseptatum TaxID=2604345 RepID=A0A428SJE4_9HYPO|nr:hypothetical protein CEP52_014768 [Fusarium oligoseptatum]
MSSNRNAPRDPERSLKTRTEGLMRKAMELTRLGVRVALYIERTDEPKAFRFKTHAGLRPDWRETSKFISGESAVSQPGSVSSVVPVPDWRSSSPMPDMKALRLDWPSMGGAPKNEPPSSIIWDDVVADRPLDPAGSSTPPPQPAPEESPAAEASATTGAAAAPRKRLSTFDASSELPVSKKAKREFPSSWFEK